MEINIRKQHRGGVHGMNICRNIIECIWINEAEEGRGKRGGDPTLQSKRLIIPLNEAARHHARF
jgi:hypothetical protein